jgi:hypothetical protein
MTIKGSQGQRRVEWVKTEHPVTALSATWEVHANHNEAQNSALRRRCSAYRRRQNLYAKCRNNPHRKDVGVSEDTFYLGHLPGQLFTGP